MGIGLKLIMVFINEMYKKEYNVGECNNIA